MLKKRIITTLLYDSTLSVVKPVCFGRPYRRLGTLPQYINVIERRNIDELIILDITATEEGRAPNFRALKNRTRGLFCPICYGGGICSLRHCELLLRWGADKLAIKTGVDLIYDAARRFGSQAIVAVIDYPEMSVSGDPFCVGLAKCYESLGAGEILLTSQGKDGTMDGYDLELIHRVSSSVNIPVICNGGCADVEDMGAALRSGADACAAGSLFLYTDTTPRECAQTLEAQGFAVRVR